MRYSFKKRIIGTLVVGVTFFTFFCIIYKILDFNKDWFPYSLMGAIFGAIAYFISESISELRSNKGTIKIIFINALIPFVIILVLSSIAKVLIGLSNCGYIILNICTLYAFLTYAMCIIIENAE